MNSLKNWPDLKEQLEKKNDCEDKTKRRDNFLESVQKAISSSGKDYISVMKNIPKEEKVMGTRWLQGIVGDTVKQAIEIIPAFT